MAATEEKGTDTATEQVAAVLGRLMDDFAGTAGVVLTALGLRLGLWDALAAGPASTQTVAERADVAVPYVREWLRSQTAAGYVAYDPKAGIFCLAPGVAAVLGGGPMAGLAAGMAAQFRAWWAELERYEEAFRTGQGISWGELPPAHAEGMDLITRAVVAPALVGGWLPALDGVADRLAAGAAVADVGCGYGTPTIAMAEAFPASRFAGFDVDDASVARARKAALAAGVADRVSFEVAAATEVPDGRYNLVTFIDSLHDLGDPVRALRRIRQVLADDGVVLLVEHAGLGPTGGQPAPGRTVLLRSVGAGLCAQRTRRPVGRQPARFDSGGAGAAAGRGACRVLAGTPGRDGGTDEPPARPAPLTRPGWTMGG